MWLWPGKRRKTPNPVQDDEISGALIELSIDPTEARRELFGLIFYLTTFGYIDGEFDSNETAFIRSTIKRVVERWVRRAATVDAADGPEAAEEVRDLVEQDTAFFNELFEAVQLEVSELLGSSVAEAEAMHVFLGCKLKQRCFEIFKSFGSEQQQQLLAAADDLLMADGVAHPAEVHLRRELAQILEVDEPPPLPPDIPEPKRPLLRLDERRSKPHHDAAPKAFRAYEYRWFTDPKVRRRQTAADRRLVKRTIATLEKERKRGRGKLRGRQHVDELADAGRFLDGFVHFEAPQRGRCYEVTVIGDLHGCYSCLKAALIQSRFFERVAAFRENPEGEPEPKLVLLGDYIDRGRFGFDGVLRLVMQLRNTAPEHVVMLRGNHEIFVDEGGQVRSIIATAEALESIRDLAPPALIQDYRRLFDSLPNALIFGRLLFTHGGIPSDAVIKEIYRDLSSLSDPDVRFQMLWSDPSIVDVIPAILQKQLVRFGFGRLQCQAFLQRLGCHTLIRGHGLVTTGFRPNFNDDDLAVFTLCSAGGPVNADLPDPCELRLVRPMALTLKLEGGLDGAVEMEAWPIEYEAFNSGARNGFYREESELESERSSSYGTTVGVELL